MGDRAEGRKPPRLKAERDLFGVKLKPPRDKNAEAKRQAAIVEFVRWVAPQIIIFAVPNGGWREKGEAARMKWTGVLAGVYDLVLVLPLARCAFWETKTDKGRLSGDQKAFRDRLSALGHQHAVIRDIDAARVELKRLGVATREVIHERTPEADLHLQGLRRPSF